MSDSGVGNVSFKVDLDPRINFAMQQNYVRVISSLRIENNFGEPLRGTHLRISLEPDFAEASDISIDVIPIGLFEPIESFDLKLSPGPLWDLTERLNGQLRFELCDDNTVIASHVEVIELLARDEWSGTRSLPEILAAFVTPNHPVIARILRTTADILEKWTDDPSLSAYQSGDPNRVNKTAAAVFSAIQDLGITYVTPPASFESEGQRIRLPDRILEGNMATCLDLAVLAAGCLEQAGLNSLVVLVRGHAFAGVWLNDEDFPESTLYDPITLRKRVDLGEILVFDPTLVTVRPQVDFTNSVNAAKHRLVDPVQFHCVVDISRSRKSQIRPIPEKLPAPNDADLPGDGDFNTGDFKPPVDLPINDSNALEGEVIPATRLDRWQRRLLDLSMRNRLLNYKDTSKTIPILFSDLSGLEDVLSEGTNLQILPRPPDVSFGDPRDPNLYRERMGNDMFNRLFREELDSKRLYADLASGDLEKRVLETYRAANLALQEGGASALYLAIGFLEYYESRNSSQSRWGPILLIPIELHRQSAKEGFYLRLGDEEPRVNVTLLEMMEKDYSITINGLDPIPRDESGIDVPRIFRMFREAIKDIKSWDVVETSSIGFFSFAKFIMWKDLVDRTDMLMANPVVGHLINTPNARFDPGAHFPNPDKLDEDKSPLDQYCPLPADSSQLAAIFAASEGRSFVLEGPPGTGKSQTITNLISHCLSEGKTVLFVSEKMAALNVVHDRLEQVGLGNYCLELHSNKARKRDVLDQLDKSLNDSENWSSEEWTQEARRIDTGRQQLNQYVDALHKKRETGESVFETTSKLIGLRNVPFVELQWPDRNLITPDYLTDARDMIGRLSTILNSLGNVKQHPWQAVEWNSWSNSWEQEVLDKILRFKESLALIRKLAPLVSEHVYIEQDELSLDELDYILRASRLMLHSKNVPDPLLVEPMSPNIEKYLDDIKIWAQKGQEIEELKEKVKDYFSEGIFGLDLDGLYSRISRASSARWPFSWWLRKQVWRELASVLERQNLPSGPRDWQELIQRITDLRDLSFAKEQLGAFTENARFIVGDYWDDEYTNWSELESIPDWVRRFHLLASQISADNPDIPDELRSKWSQLISRDPSLIKRDGTVGELFVEYQAAYEQLLSLMGQVNQTLHLNVEKAWGDLGAVRSLSYVDDVLQQWITHIPDLRPWCQWKLASEEAREKYKLAALLDAFDNGDGIGASLSEIFESSFYHWWHSILVDGEPVLSQFYSPEYERQINQFREIDKRYLALTNQAINQRLKQKMPISGGINIPSGDVGILKREIGKRARNAPIRQLFQMVPNLLARLKPCVLMSPMSVAQYLDARHPSFDIVVFDEASQIPVWDAVGAIARGSQTVVVGDPKQLPPTNFFQRAEDLDEDENGDIDSEIVEDLENILDDCISAQIPVLSLDWHYRSRHESLIAFSNYHYYDNRLLTFPSPDLEGMGVSWQYVENGAYDRGKSATNRNEATAIVNEITRRLKHNELSKSSIGVVTFSQAQQKLIEDLLEDLRRSDPVIDYFFSENVPEPVFVKNLENVQGDERDVILFSICYGPDLQGRISMNFGPMNREGGERRLNVAITRAKQEVVVFSSIKADDINLARTRARGVSDLKNFLDYAERGPVALIQSSNYNPDADFDSPFEKEVYDALVKRGWEVHKQVGCANYRIDLAVVNPDASGNYLLGVECDGANYHRAKTARDRDILREGVLNGLGWSLFRIWSTDWWSDPEKEILKLEQVLETTRLSKLPSTTIMAEPDDANLADPTKVEEGLESSSILNIGKASDFASARFFSNFESSSLIVGSDSADSGVRDRSGRQHENNLQKYVPMLFQGQLGSPHQFYESNSEVKIMGLISEIVEYEGPITLNLLARRIIDHWSMGRLSGKAMNLIKYLLPKDRVQLDSTLGQESVWPHNIDIDSYRIFRVPGQDPNGQRSLKDIPIQEVANIVLYILAHQIRVPETAAIKETARVLGLKKSGSGVRSHVALGIQYLVSKNLVRLEGDLIVLQE